jgi:hypothetical protein
MVPSAGKDKEPSASQTPVGGSGDDNGDENDDGDDDDDNDDDDNGTLDDMNSVQLRNLCKSLDLQTKTWDPDKLRAVIRADGVDNGNKNDGDDNDKDDNHDDAKDDDNDKDDTDDDAKDDGDDDNAVGVVKTCGVANPHDVEGDLAALESTAEEMALFDDDNDDKNRPVRRHIGGGGGGGGVDNGDENDGDGDDNDDINDGTNDGGTSSTGKEGAFPPSVGKEEVPPPPTHVAPSASFLPSMSFFPIHILPFLLPFRIRCSPPPSFLPPIARSSFLSYLAV